MDITHNKINSAISEMENVVSKGQPFAKANKERHIRAVLRTMLSEQLKPPTIKEIWFYFRMWSIFIIRKETWTKVLNKKET